MPSVLKLISVGVFLMLVVGVLCRRKRAAHIPIMLGAIAIDLGMVAYIEFTRDAVASAKSKMGPLMVVHLIFSFTVLITYAMQVYTGIRKARGGIGRLHGSVMPLMLGARLGNLVTSFLVG